MRSFVASLFAVGAAVAAAHAQTGPQVRPAAPEASASAAAVTAGVVPPAGYVVGTDDVLSVVFWHDKDMSADVVVRPDGRITLPLINEIEAAGLTPGQLRDRIEDAAHRYVPDATVMVAVKELKSRKIFVTGAVERPGVYPLTTPTTVLQMIATAGGLKEYADSKNIVVMRTEGAVQASYFFDYKSVVKHKKLSENIILQPGDTLVVP